MQRSGARCESKVKRTKALWRRSGLSWVGYNCQNDCDFSNMKRVLVPTTPLARSRHLIPTYIFELKASFSFDANQCDHGMSWPYYRPIQFQECFIVCLPYRGGGGGGASKSMQKDEYFKLCYCCSSGTGVHLGHCIIFLSCSWMAPKYFWRCGIMFLKPDWSTRLARAWLNNITNSILIDIPEWGQVLTRL